MKKLLLVTTILMLMASLAAAQQVGSVSGTVRDSLNNPVGGAMISLMAPGGGHGMDYRAFSGPDGNFSIGRVTAGPYIAQAYKMGVGRDMDSISVVAGQNTVVDFVLGSGHNPPPPPPPPAGFGSVSGTVYDSLNVPVAGAMVDLMSGGMRRHGDMGFRYHTQTGPDGAFAIDSVAAGHYMAMAAKMGVGHDNDSIAVVADQNTIVNFVLTTMGGHDRQRPDSLRIITVSGWVMVVADSMRTHYFLDVDGDDAADFRLMFGPSWYEPNSGAHRPVDGDSIWVTGGIIGYGQPQGIVVYEINGLFWRTPGRGHGGHGGRGCPDPDSVVLIETAGFAMVEENPMMTRYFLDTNNDNTADYHLMFGPPDYDPGNGATRPNDGDSIAILGGLIEGPRGEDMIIVYEINGQFWRSPGDTTQLWLDVTAIDEAPGLPTEYLVAKSYPNPFNPTAIISFELGQTEQVRVAVYDLLGRQIAVLADGIFQAGQNQVTFNANNYSTSSVYFYKVSAQSGEATGKMVLLK